MSWLNDRGAPGVSSRMKNGGKGRFIYLSWALDRRMDPDYIKIRVEKEN
jgi:hypothetical protein